MMNEAMDERIVDQAIAWHLAQLQDDCDWEAFTQWLEEDRQHREAFDGIALLDDAITRQSARLTSIEAEPVEHIAEASRPKWWAWGGGVAAAALAGAVALPMFLAQTETDYRTAPGQTRTITFADGRQVQLAGGSHLVVTGKAGLDMKLAGAAWFDVPHDRNRIITIQAGPYQVTDIGTSFEIVAPAPDEARAGPGAVKVAVASGSLSVNNGGLASPVRLHAGQRILLSQTLNLAEVSDTVKEGMASWRRGQLSYQDVPLSLVVADISRYSGKRVTVDPALAGRRFSGVLSIGDGSQLVSNITQLAGLKAVPDGGSVHLVDGAG